MHGTRVHAPIDKQRLLELYQRKLLLQSFSDALRLLASSDFGSSVRLVVLSGKLLPGFLVGRLKQLRVLLV